MVGQLAEQWPRFYIFAEKEPLRSLIYTLARHTDAFIRPNFSRGLVKLAGTPKIWWANVEHLEGFEKIRTPRQWPDRLAMNAKKCAWSSSLHEMKYLK